MLSRLRTLFDLALRSPAERPWYASLGFSLVVHVALIGVMAGMWTQHAAQVDARRVDTRWSLEQVEPSYEMEIERPEDRHAATLPQAEAAGGREIGPVLDLAQRQPTLEVRPPARLTGQQSANHDFVAVSDPLADVGELPGASGGGGTGGKGNGSGGSEGDGAGSGFFGVDSTGQSVVFVVDSSSSMNHPHDSEAKTRFGKLKLELVRAISRMDESKSFYIIFFNDEAVPMPADGMQSATPTIQRQFLEWVVGVQARGQTDPREALVAAMRMQPDVIFFLTDGNFEARIRRDLRKMTQRRIAIHTIAFGNRIAEKALKEFAGANRGEYRFIP